jgi:hypothetical protein
MKLILCTLAICLSILASVFTTTELIHAEGKKIRSSIPKAQAEPADLSKRPDTLVMKLDAINAQLSTLNRRLASLEASGSRQAPSVPPNATTRDSASLQNYTAVNSATLAQLDAVSGHLVQLTTFVDQSFEHLEKTVTETAAAQRIAEALEPMANKVDAIDSYFTPLYAFLGLDYDPANADLMAAYPSVDLRLNELLLQIEALQKDLDYVKERVPRIVEPIRYPR